MIAFFRRAMSSWLVLGLLGLVLIAFIVTGVGDPFGGMGGSGDRIATIGKAAITETQIRSQLDRAVRNARQQDSGLDTATYVRAGGYDQLVSQAIVSEAVKQWAEKNGFAASKRQVDGEIASIPAFQVGGRFDQASYAQALSQQKLSDRELRQGLTGDLLRKQVLTPVAAGSSVSDGMVKPYAQLMVEERKGSIAIVPSVLLADKQLPSDAEVQAFYTKNRSRYLVPERRVLRYAVIGPENVAAAAIPTDAEVQAFYSANQSSYGPSEKRRLSQVILPDAVTAKAFVDRARKGESFEKLASERGFSSSDIAIGERTLTDFTSATSANVAKAAFMAKQGTTTDPVQSDYGWHVVRVDAIASTPGRTLQSVRAEILQKIEAQKRDEAFAALVAKIEDSFANGQNMSEVVKANGLKEIQTPPLTAAGVSPEQPAYVAPPEVRAVLKPAFALAPDDDPVVETIGNDHYLVVAPGQILEAAARPLASIRDQVAVDLVREKAFEKAGALASSIVARVKKGEPLAKLLAEAKLPPLQTAGGRRVDVAARGNQVPPPLAMLFTLPKNGIRTLAAPREQGWFIVKVDELKAGDLSAAPQILQATRAQFSQMAGEEYISQFAQAVATDVGVKKNEKVIGKLKQQLLGGSQGAQ